MDSVIFLENPATYEKELHKALGQQVKDVMNEKVPTTAPDTALREAARLMHRKEVPRLVVVDKAEATAKVVERSAPKDKSTGNTGSSTTTSSPGASTRSFGSAVVESQEEQKVLVLGAGRVSMSLVDLLGRTAQKHIQVASDNDEEAREVRARDEKDQSGSRRQRDERAVGWLAAASGPGPRTGGRA